MNNSKPSNPCPEILMFLCPECVVSVSSLQLTFLDMNKKEKFMKDYNKELFEK